MDKTTLGEIKPVALFLPSLPGGGAERVFVRLASRFVEAGHKVDLVLMTSERMSYRDELSNQVRVIDLHVPRLWPSAFALAKYLRQEKPSAILSGMPIANAVAVLGRALSGQRTRLVISEHNARSLVFGDVESPRHRPLAWAVRYAYPFADGVVAVSRGVADRLLTVPNIKDARIEVIYNPCWTVGMADLAAQPAGIPWSLEGGVPIVLAAGRLEKQKDFSTLIAAFAALARRRSARLLIIGEGSQKELLQRQIEAAGLASNVLLAGFHDNPFPLMAKASVFVLSSVHEGFGNVLVEAMACGTPVVSTDCPSGPSEILDGGRYGPLVPVGDAVALADAIEATLDNPTPADVLIRRAKEFSLDAAAEAYMRVLGLSSVETAS